MLDIFFTAKFKKDFKRLQKQGKNMGLLASALEMLASGQSLPENMRDHSLSGDYRGHRECHLAPDWLLVYRVDKERLVLTATRTGSHSELFDL